MVFNLIYVLSVYSQAIDCDRGNLKMRIKSKLITCVKQFLLDSLGGRVSFTHGDSDNVVQVGFAPVFDVVGERRAEESPASFAWTARPVDGSQLVSEASLADLKQLVRLVDNQPLGLVQLALVFAQQVDDSVRDGDENVQRAQFGQAGVVNFFKSCNLKWNEGIKSSICK